MTFPVIALQAMVSASAMDGATLDTDRHRIGRAGLAVVRSTLVTASGQEVDCVDILSQPALNGGLLEIPPRFSHTVPAHDEALPGNTADAEELYEATADGGFVPVAGCASGTVPIPRMSETRRAEYRAASSPKRYGSTASHQYALAWRNVTNWGAQATINLWAPNAEVASDYNLGMVQVSVPNPKCSYYGSCEPRSTDYTLEAGVQVFPDLYGDTQPHLFVHANHGLIQDSCFNNTCNNGFVQVHPAIFPGIALGPVSAPDGQQGEVTVELYKDRDEGAWWLAFNGQLIGYYPRDPNFADSYLRYHASRIAFGGMVRDAAYSGSHSTTDMGSGRHWSEGYGRAAYMRLMYYTAFNGTLIQKNDAFYWPWDRNTYVTDNQCYSVGNINFDSGGWRSFLYFGGPGFDSTNCR